MKKTLIAVLVLMMAASAFAVNPVGKGKILLEGGSSAFFAKQGGDRYEGSDKPTWIQFQPSGGFFIVDGIAIGATIVLDKYSQGDFKSTGFHFGPRINWFPTAKKMDEAQGKIAPCISASLLLTSDKTEHGGNIDDDKTSGYAAQFGVGGVLFLSNSFGLHGEAYFAIGSEKVKEPEELESVGYNEFGIMLSLQGFFGGAK